MAKDPLNVEFVESIIQGVTIFWGTLIRPPVAPSGDSLLNAQQQLHVLAKKDSCRRNAPRPRPVAHSCSHFSADPRLSTSYSPLIFNLIEILSLPRSLYRRRPRTITLLHPLAPTLDQLTTNSFALVRASTSPR